MAASSVVVSRKRPRDPGIVLGAISLAGLVLFATVALTEAAPAPPSIAEFAPQAVEQIKDAPTEQEGDVGLGGGGGRAATTTTTPPAADDELVAAPVDAVVKTVPRTRRCVGDPPRQTEDPQSPPCVPFFSGDNGGATAKGVTPTEIRVALPAFSASNNPEGLKLRRAITAFMNERFEFYGRRIVLVPVGPERLPTSTGAAYQQEIRAVAAEADAKNVFASLSLPGTDTGAYEAELIRRGILSAGFGRGSPDAKQKAPYEWAYAPSLDTTIEGFGEWVCKQLVGKPATWAQNERQNRPRKFGVLYSKPTGESYDPVAVFDRIIQGCGAEPVLSITMPIHSNSTVQDPNHQAAYRSNAAKMCDPSKMITTVVDFTSGGDIQRYHPAFTSQNCHPEWVLNGFGASDQNSNYVQTSQAEQRDTSFGLSWKSKQIPFVDQPAFHALKEADPNYQFDPRGYAQGLSQSYTVHHYNELLLLASGLQMAGPRLSPRAFEAGLHRTKFPNPDHPTRKAKVDFTDGDYTMTDDSVEMWWSEQGLDPTTNNPGAQCYIRGGGNRYRRGTFPSEPSPFFEPPCDSGARAR